MNRANNRIMLIIRFFLFRAKKDKNGVLIATPNIDNSIKIMPRNINTG